LTLCLSAFLPGSIHAQNIYLNNGGSVAAVNPGNGTGQLGMNYWYVDTINQNQLAQQWFWYSTDGGHTVQPINALTEQAPQLTGGNDLTLTYANSSLAISIEYILAGVGAGSGAADITENIHILNLDSVNSLNFNLYQYSHFQLLQTADNSVVVFPDGGSGYSSAEQSNGGTAIAEGIIQPDANSADTGLAGSVYADVLSGSLNNQMSAGPGDVAWAFGWSTVIGANGEFDIEKDKSLSISGVVPEPSTFALIALGLGACGLVRRRKAS
jgi:hypothetical protein